jgi:hypothetical protein
LKRGIYIGICFCLTWVCEAYSQHANLRFSGRFNDVPFPEFVSMVEQQTGCTFYYYENWVGRIKVTLSGQDLSLQEVLDRLLLPAAIHWYMDEFGNIYLTPDQPVIPVIPASEYSRVRDSVEEKLDEQMAITRAEQRYLEGHESGLLETLVIGNEPAGDGHGEVFIHGKIVDSETGEPLIGATIYVESLKKGAATDVNGRFSLLLATGKHRVSFNCMGMKARQYN